MFEDVRQALRDLLNGSVAPEDRRQILDSMRSTLVRARMALDDLRQGAEATRKRLTTERLELETIRRRKTLAVGIGDAQTVEVATRFESHHAERVALLEKKLEAEEGELVLVRREVEEMTEQLKSATAGVGSGLNTPRGTAGVSGERERAGSGGAQGGEQSGEGVEGTGEHDAGLERELDSLARERRRAAREAEADTRLAELKRRMGL